MTRYRSRVSTLVSDRRIHRSRSVATFASREFTTLRPRLTVSAVPSKIAAIAGDPSYTSMRASVYQDISIAPFDVHFFHSILEEDKYEAFELYGHVNKTEATGFIHFGDKLCGHDGVVHGGCIATMFDEFIVMTMLWTEGTVGFTANLSVNYHKPLLPRTSGIVHLELAKKEGRKVFYKASLVDDDGTLYSDATSLYILPRH
ncbi:Aste57867_13703 [Aphanomyces stellatus]|uniref:Acyl-coenzyme A thioesterase THEM4 n=1 Tax=Aphanomyces stellatus TaxID=120398 RepID=A0A485KYR3_9STRA|nr:hypothetical protein As57867_013653 [Aphanomyces stellatus]VFT90536.1 Aste57867_13703 [Aphanomyces stellatus]